MGKIKPLNEVRRPEWAHDVNVDKYMEENKAMTDQAREARRAYKREWNKRNKDKVAAAQRRYWEKKAQAAQDQADRPGNTGGIADSTP